ncbi:MAG: glycosyltransferase family 2 protein [Chlamydiota bacterium]
MEPNSLISVIVLHYANLSDTQECLASLSSVDDPHFNILLIDNGTGDPALEQLKAPGLTLIRNAHNLGFAEGNNVGIRYALDHGAGAVLLLNNDTTVAPSLLTAFRQASQLFPQAGALGAKIYFYDDPPVIWHAGGMIDRKTVHCRHLGCGDTDREKRWENYQEVDYVCGCALFATRQAIEAAGLLAPEFFLMWEEVDWCYRMRMAGYPSLFVPQAKLWHKISQSFEEGNRCPSRLYYYCRNRLLFLKRHFSFKERVRFYFLSFGKELFNFGNKRREYLAYLRGTRDYFFGKFYAKSLKIK